MSTSSSSPQSMFAVVKRRAGWILLVAAAFAAAAGSAVMNAEPRYTAIASFEIQGHSLPAGARNSNPGSDVGSLAEAHITERHDRVIQSSGISSARFEVASAELDAAASNEPTMTIAYDVLVEAPDRRSAERDAQALIDAYFEDDARIAAAPAVAPAEREAAQAEIDAAAAAKRAVEAQLAELGWTPGEPTDLRSVSRQAIADAQREHARLAAELNSLEARRNELDRAMADMQRGAADFRPESGQFVTTQTLVALQSRHAILLGLYGADYGPAVELGEMIDTAQAEAASRYRTVSAELETARAEFQALQITLPIDHPDVVRLAHRVSALESEAARLDVAGLTRSERAYIEDLGRERRAIDGEINAMRDAVAAAETGIADARARAEEVPALERRYSALLDQLDAADRREAAAWEQLEALEARAAEARRRSPGTLTVAGAPVVTRVAMSRPEVIAAVGAVVALVAIFLVVALLERLDRRIVGARSITRLQGMPPLVEIPVLAGS